MAARPWRGTLIYTGMAAAIAAAGIAKFAGAMPEAAGADDGASSVVTPADSSTEQAAPDETTPDQTTPDEATPDEATPDDTPSSDPTATASPDSSSGDDVTIVGAVEQTRYGSIQLSVTFSGDTITDVQALQTPDRERRSAEISQESVPILTQEVLSAQSAQIDTVSGATYTSDGYRESLQSAIDQRA